METKFKNRVFETLLIADNQMTITKRFGLSETVFPKTSIKGVHTKNSMYDIPFFETTLILMLEGGKKFKFKRMSKKKAKEAVELINNNFIKP